MDIPAYYASLKKQKASLDENYPEGSLYLTSVANTTTGSTAGSVAQVPTAIAAKALVGGTARISTDAEIAAHLERGARSVVLANTVTQRTRENAGQVTLIAEPPKC